MRGLLAGLVGAVVLASHTAAQVIPPYMPGHVAPKAEEPPPRLLERASIARPIALGPAEESAPELLDAMEAWNRAGSVPTRVGFSRPLPETIRADFRAAPAAVDAHSVHAQSKSGSLLWGTKIAVRGASAIRVHLSNVRLPAGTRFWSYGAAGRVTSFGMELVSASGDLWTPLIFGETAYLEAESPAGGGEGFSITDVVEVRLGAATTPPCLVDAACVTSSDFDAIEPARRAVAFLAFMENNLLYACTGTLLNDTNSSGTPYLLTAAHCLSTPPEVSSLVAVWDYVDATCNGAPPDPSTLPQSSGGTLLSTSANSDYTFLRLNDAPGDRAFMGWDQRPNSVFAGTTIYRISHPDPGGTASPQSFAESVVDTNNNYVCIGVGRDRYLYSRTGEGAIGGGSSGAAAMIAGGYVVGQLYTPCPSVNDYCTQQYEPVDGLFSLTYVGIAQWLSPVTAPPVANFAWTPSSPGPGQAITFGDTSTGAPTSWSWTFGDGTGSNVQSPVKAYAAAGTYTVTLTVSNGSGSSSVSKAITVVPCAASATALCLDLGRFQVTAHWTKSDGTSGDGSAVSLTADTGYFWFFDPTNVEVITKVLEGCAVDQFRWVFASGLTNVGVTLTVVDAVTQESKTYTNVVGTAFQPVQDTKAFACN